MKLIVFIISCHMILIIKKTRAYKIMIRVIERRFDWKKYVSIF